MNKADKCSYIINRISLFKIPEFAALWCGVPKNRLDGVLGSSRPASDSAEGRQVLRNDSYPCLEPRCIFICQAIREDKLVTFNETGAMNPPESVSHSAWDRKRIRPDKALEWLQNTDIPVDEMPEFLTVQEDTTEECFSAKKEASYKKVIYALLKRIGQTPFTYDEKGVFTLNRTLTGWVKTEIQKNGLSLGDDTIREILKGLQTIAPRK